MVPQSSIKLFISYSHGDENYVEKFIKHIAPLKDKGLIKEWRDRKIYAGQDFQNTIDNNLDHADIICLFISANFLASDACMREKRVSFNLKNKKGVPVIPIILSPCGWKDDESISKVLALPKDGKALTEFGSFDAALHDVYEGLKRVIEVENKFRQITLSDEFSSFLRSTDLLTKAHGNKEEVTLEDIFVFPELEKYDVLKERGSTLSSQYVVEHFLSLSKVVISGEDQSGKTALCKKIFKELRQQNLIPIYIVDNAKTFEGLILNKVEKAFNEQYRGALSFAEIDKDRLIPIVDDFHYAKKKEKHIADLSQFRNQVLIVDDIFSLNLKDENLMKTYHRYTIKEYSPTMRNKLIEKWVFLSGDGAQLGANAIYKEIDDATELVDTTLGKIFSSGIMPAYPFFVLSIISTYETFAKPLDQDITSQGYCYQALIYLYLRKQGVQNDQIDTYINFLTELAFYIFVEKKRELPVPAFKVFMAEYLRKFNLPIDQENLMRTLRKTKILVIDSFGNYAFYYDYLYYFFVAKYLAEHRKDNSDIIATIINNLHKNENAYIAVFIAHHSKSIDLLDEILLNSMLLFSDHQPARLTKEETSFFDKEIDALIKATLPTENDSSETVRAERLKERDQNEESRKRSEEKLKEKDENENNLSRELRRSVKTVEVMGNIIKNRAGSLEKDKLENIFLEAINVHLRILTSFFVLLQDEKEQLAIMAYLKAKMEAATEDKSKNRVHHKPSQEELEKICRKIFWGLSFSVVYGLISKIVHSLGSDKLHAIVEKVCDEVKSPATFLVKHGILMWYGKNVQVEKIAKEIEGENFSETAKQIIKFMIVDHCRTHKISPKDKQKIEVKLGIRPSRLIAEELKS